MIQKLLNVMQYSHFSVCANANGSIHVMSFGDIMSCSNASGIGTSQPSFLGKLADAHVLSFAWICVSGKQLYSCKDGRGCTLDHWDMHY